MAEQAGSPVPARQTTEQAAAEKTALGPGMATDPEKPEDYYFLASDKTTKVNAWGEVKGSAEDKKRWA